MLVLSTKNLSKAQTEQVLSAAGLLNVEKQLTTAQLSERLAKELNSKADAEALLITSGLITQKELEENATIKVTAAKINESIANGTLSASDAGVIGGALGITGVNTGATISFDLLTASIWANIKALGAWLVTNPIGWAILGGTAIFGLVKAYDALTDSVEEVKERTDALLETYNSAISEANSNAQTIESLASRYEKLSKGVNNLGENVSLTADEYSEYNDIVNQIADMFPTMITGYTDEGNAILSLKGNVEELRDAYKEAQKEAYNLLIISEDDIVTNYHNQVHGNESWLSKQSSYIDGEAGAKDAIEIITRLTGALTPDEFRETYNRLYKEYENIWHSNKIQDALKSSGFEELTHAPKWSEITVEDLANVKYSAQATIQTYNAEIESQLSNIRKKANAYLMTNADYEKLDEQSKTAASLLVNSINENIANEFSSNEDVGAYVCKLVTSISDSDEVQNALKDLFTIDSSDMSIGEVRKATDSYINTIATAIGENPTELKVRLDFDDSDTQPLINNVKEKLKDDFDDKVRELTLEELQIAAEKIEVSEDTLLSWDELIEKINEVKNLDTSSSTLSLPDAIKAVNGFKEGDTEITGLIDELSLLQEVLSDTGNIQEETYSKLISCSDKYSTAIQTENGRITVNTSKLKQVAKSRQLDTQESIKQTLAIKKQEWMQWSLGIENYNGTLLENIENTYGDIDALQQQITQFELLKNSVDNASSAFENFKNAQSTEDQDMYNTTQDAFDILKGYSSDTENENFGKYNRDEFQEAAMLLMDNDTYKKALNAKDIEEYQKVVSEFVKSIEPLFDEKNYNSAANLFDRINEIIDSGDVPEADADWAKRLGISEEMFHALAQFGDQYDFENKEIFEGYNLNTLEEYQSRLSNVKAAQDALNECTDTTSKEYMKLSKELEDAEQKCSEFENETINSLNEAYKTFTESGASSKGSFSDYLKNTMELDDNDITGITDVMIGKAQKLQEQMMKIPSSSERYKELGQQLYEVNQQLEGLGHSAPVEISTQDGDIKSLEDKLDEYKNLKEQAESYKKQLSTMDEGTSSYKHTEQELDRIQEKMLELGSPIKIEIQSNITEIDTEISHLNDKIGGLKESLQHASGSNEAHAIHMEMMGANNEKANLEEQKSDLEKKLKIVVDDSEAVEKTEALQNEEIEDKSFDVNITDNATTVLDKIENRKLSDKDLNVNVNVNNPSGVNLNGGAAVTNPTPQPKAKADGTFNAFAQGTGSSVSIPKNEKALVNELGEEGVVRNGKLIPIKGGAQFINLKRGDIVFNHKQMEQLKKNGYTTGRGKLIGAHVDGTVNAFKSGTGTKINVPNLIDVTTNNKAIVAAKNASKEVSDTVKEKAEEEKDAFEEIFDWIERRIKNFQRKFDKWFNQAETALTSGFITKYYKKATKSLRKELNTYGKAYNRYMKEANSVGLSKKYRKKVKNGTIDIESIKDEELAEKIKSYQDYYDKAIDSTTSFVETAEQLYNLPLDKAATKIEKFSDAIDLLDKKLDNAIGSKAKNKLIDQQTIQQKNTLDAYVTASSETKKKLANTSANLLKSNTLKNSGVTEKEKKAIQNAVKNGTEVNLAYFKEGSKGYNAAVKYNEALKANAQAVYDLQSAQEDYASWLVEASKLKFDNIADDYEKNIQKIDYQMSDLENRMSEIESRGKNVNRSYYESQTNVNNAVIEQLKKERSELEQSLKGIKRGTDEWYDAYDKLKQIDSDISQKVRDNYDNVNKINQLYFSLFEDISSSIGRIITEQEFLQSLFAHEKTTDSETGNFTDAGFAKLGSLSASYSAAKNRADKDGALVKELEEVRKSGAKADGSYKLGKWEFNSLEDLDEKIEETYTTWQNDIKETYGIESSIVDLMKEKYQAELDYLKELIDAKKEALTAEKDLHDYQKSIQEKTNDISTIQKQIAAYSGDTSQEAMSKLQKLQKELADKQDDLKETEYDRYISDQQDMLDKLYEEYEELITKKLEDFMGLFQEGISLSNENTSLISDYLKSVADANGYTEETKGLFNGVSETIKDSVNSIIDVIVNKRNEESGTKSDGQGGAVSSAADKDFENAYSSSTSGNSSSTPSSSSASGNSSGSQTGNDSGDKTNLIRDFIAGKAKKATKKKAEYSDFNKRIYENQSNSYKGTGRYLPKKDREDLAKLLGVQYNNASKNGNLYKKLKSLKFPGFKKGGVVSVDDIEKQVKENGDDGLASVKNGETILTPVQTDLFQQFTDKMPEMMSAVDTSNLVKIENPLEYLRTISDARSMNNVVNIDNITLPNVTNYKEFKAQMLHDIQNDKKTGMIIRDVAGINQIAGDGRLNKFKHRV